MSRLAVEILDTRTMSGVSAEGPNAKFYVGNHKSPWYRNLAPDGDCLKLFCLLRNKPELLREIGKGNVTVLHKAVRHGYTKLVRHIFGMFDEHSDVCRLGGIDVTREDLLCKTDDNKISAVMLAIMVGNHDVVRLFKDAIILCDKEFDVDAFDYVKEDSNYTVGIGDGILEDVMGGTSSSNSTCQALEDIAVINDEGVGSGQGLKNVASTGEQGDDHVIVVEEQNIHPHPTGSTSHDNASNLLQGSDNESLKNNWEIICSIVKEILVDESDANIQQLRRQCEKDVNFNFVAPEEIFLHYVVSKASDSSSFKESAEGYAIETIKRNLLSRECGVILFKELLSHHDPQGRTPLHIAIQNDINPRHLIPEGEKYRDCWDTRDGAGRTLLHWVSMNSGSTKFIIIDIRKETQDVDGRVYPSNYLELRTLLNWRSPNGDYPQEYDSEFHCTSLHLAVLHNNHQAVWHLMFILGRDNIDIDCNPILKGRVVDAHLYCFVGTPIQLAASLGHHQCFDHLLRNNMVDDYGKLSCNLKSRTTVLPALHIAVSMGKVECLRLILKDSNYDILVGFDSKATRRGMGDSALHAAVAVNFMNSKNPLKLDLLHVVDIAPHCNQPIQRFKSHLETQTTFNVESEEFGYDGDQIACINLLLQGGIDIWTTNFVGDEPYPGPYATQAATKWWYDKVTSEVMEVKKNLGDASNATSVIAALVATASFVGPLQPPLGFTSAAGLVQSDRLPLRIYFASNGLAFYLSVASLLMSVIPSLPMPKQSMQEELRRSQRSLRVASFLLSVSIICVLVTFSVANIAVVPVDWSSKWYIVVTIILGWLACMFVLILFFCRLIRLTFHRHMGVRRYYDKYVIL